MERIEKTFKDVVGETANSTLASEEYTEEDYYSNAELTAVVLSMLVILDSVLTKMGAKWVIEYEEVSQ